MRYPLDRDLSSGYPYPPFEQLGPGLYRYHSVVYKRVKWVMPDLTSCKNALLNCLLLFFISMQNCIIVLFSEQLFVPQSNLQLVSVKASCVELICMPLSNGFSFGEISFLFIYLCSISYEVKCFDQTL